MRNNIIGKYFRTCSKLIHFPQHFLSEDDAGEDTTEAVPSTSTSKAASDKSIPPTKVPHKFDELIDIEKENLLIKRQNLLLKQEKLKLQIELLKRNVGNSETAQNGDKVYFAL